MNEQIPKILITPPHDWYIEVYAKYIMKYLSDSFFMELAYIPYPPYDNFESRFPEVNPALHRSPEKFDLIWPLYPKAWNVDKDKYAYKVAQVFFEPIEDRYHDVAVVASTTPMADKAFGDFPHHKLHWATDTDLLKPINMIREDNLLHVGMVGTIINPRRMVNQILPYIKDIDGIRLMFVCREPIKTEHDMNAIGGLESLKYIIGSEKYWTGMPLVYNRFDVILRIEQDPAVSFPVIEAAACGIPCIATPSGIDHFFTLNGGGILIEPDEVDANGNGRTWFMNHPDEVGKRVRDAIIWMRDHKQDRKNMGLKARQEAENHWQWKYHIPKWKQFFTKGVERARRYENRTG